MGNRGRGEEYEKQKSRKMAQVLKNYGKMRIDRENKSEKDE